MVTFALGAFEAALGRTDAPNELGDAKFVAVVFWGFAACAAFALPFVLAVGALWREARALGREDVPLAPCAERAVGVCERAGRCEAPREERRGVGFR